VLNNVDGLLVYGFDLNRKSMGGGGYLFVRTPVERSALIGSGGTGALAAALAVASAALGLVVERWLFFAEAKHTVTLYYGAAAV